MQNDLTDQLQVPAAIQLLLAHLGKHQSASVLLALAARVHSACRTTEPTLAEIAADAAVDMRTARKAIASLVSMGVIAVEQRSGKPNQYSVQNTSKWVYDKAPGYCANPPSPELPTADSALHLRLTDDQLQMISTDLDQLIAYLLFGSQAVGHPASNNIQQLALEFPPAPTNWTTECELDSGGKFLPSNAFASLTDQQIGGLWWCRVATYRTMLGFGSGLPNSFQRIFRDINTLRSTMSSIDLQLLITYLPDHRRGLWDLIRCRLAPLGESLELDETTLGNNLVIAQAREMLSYGKAWLHEEVAKMRAISYK